MCTKLIVQLGRSSNKFLMDNSDFLYFCSSDDVIYNMVINGPLWRNLLVTGGFPSQRASYAEIVSVSWRHYDTKNCGLQLPAYTV